MRVALVAAVLSCGGCSWQEAGPKAHQGRIVVNAQNSETPLAGQWAFYWNRLLTPADFRKPILPKPDGFLEQPGAWNDFKIDGRPIGGNGVATLRLIVDAGPQRRDLGFQIPTVATAYRLWIDGKLVSARGTLSVDPNSEFGVPSHRLVTVSSDGRPLELVLQISNHRTAKGGVLRAFLIGPERLLEQDSLSVIRLAQFVSGGLLMIALYHFAIFLFRRNDYSSLYLGLFCLSWMAYILTQYDHDLWTDQILPQSALGVLGRAEWLIFYFSL